MKELLPLYFKSLNSKKHDLLFLLLLLNGPTLFDEFAVKLGLLFLLCFHIDPCDETATIQVHLVFVFVTENPRLTSNISLRKLGLNIQGKKAINEMHCLHKQN